MLLQRVHITSYLHIGLHVVISRLYKVNKLSNQKFLDFLGFLFKTKFKININYIYMNVYLLKII